MRGSDVVARLAIDLTRYLETLDSEIDSEWGNRRGDPVMLALLVVLYNIVMTDSIWQHRDDFFRVFGSANWPDQEEARNRINELLDGVNLRSDFWLHN